MVCGELADAFTSGSKDALLNEFSNHADETGMVARRAGTGHVNFLLIAIPSRFIVKIVEHLHVVRQKSDGRNHHLVDAGGF